MSIFSVRQLFIDGFKDHLKETVHKDAVQPHRGTFQSIQELRKLCTRSLSVLVSIRAVENLEQEFSHYEGDVIFFVHVIAGKTRGQRPEETAGLIAESIASWVADNAAALEVAEGVPQRIRFVDITTLNIDQEGIALWQVSWQQRVRYDAVDLTNMVGVFEGFDADHHFENKVSGDDNASAQTTDTYPE